MNVFDLDGTLITCNSSFALLQELRKASLISTRDFIFASKSYTQYLAGFFSVHELFQAVFNRFCKGVPLKVLEEASQHVVKGLLSTRLNPFVVSELNRLKSTGSPIILLSSSPHFLVKLISEGLNVTHFKGSQFFLDSNHRLLSISSILVGEAKLQAATEFFPEAPVQAVYSDSHEDLPLLEAAHDPIAVRPTRQLKSIAKKRGWKIIY